MSILVSFVRPLAYLSLPYFLLRSIANSSAVGRYYVRLFVYLGSLVTAGTYGFISSFGLAFAGHRFDVNYYVAKFFYAIARRSLDVNVIVEGEEHLRTRPAVLMSNHQSMLDIIVLGRLMPKSTAIIAKQSLQFTPLGPFMMMAGTIFIDRGNNNRAIQSLEAAGEIMKRLKLSLWMFPEGTRNSAEISDILPLKKGGFHLAIKAGIPIIPIVTENYWRIYRKDVFDSGSIKVRVLPPVPTEGLTAADVPALASRVRDQMLEALREISVRIPSGQSLSSAVTPRDTTDGKNPLFADSTSPEPPTEEAPPSTAPSSPFSAEGVLEASMGSSSSLAMSEFSSSRSKYGASENGAETEEDEGMVLVGRPAA